MSANSLLLWMSAKNEGSWAQFRAIVEELHLDSDEPSSDGAGDQDSKSRELPIYQQLRLSLERLAHVEFFPVGLDCEWRIVPPVLAAETSNQGWRAVACGARPPDLIDKLRSLPGTVTWAFEEMPSAPDTLLLRSAEQTTLVDTANLLDSVIQPKAPLALLCAVPPVDDRRSRVPATPPTGPGWMIDEFLPASLQWSQVNRRHVSKSRTGLFRFQMAYQRFYFLKSQGQTYKVPVQLGKFAILRGKQRRGIVEYDRERTVVTVPVTYRPPLITERALVLCSGRLPTVDLARGRLEYREVPDRVVRLAANVLRQGVTYR